MALATSLGLQVLHGGCQFVLRNAGQWVLAAHTQLGNPETFTGSWKRVFWTVHTTLGLP